MGMLFVQHTDNTDKQNTDNTDKQNTDNTDKQNTDNTDKQNTDNTDKQNTDNTDKQNTDNTDKQNTDNTDKQNTDNTDKQNTDNTDKQNEDKQNTDHSHCHFVRVEHSWAVTWTCPSAVPTTPCGNCSSRTERGTSTVCDTAACWSVGTDPSRLLWHQDGQTLTQ